MYRKRNPFSTKKNTETTTEKHKHRKDCSDIEKNIDAEKIDQEYTNRLNY